MAFQPAFRPAFQPAFRPPFGASGAAVITQAEALAMLYPGAEIGAYYEVHPDHLSQDSAGTTPVTADSQPVGRMLDLSGNGNHITQADAARRPLYRTDGTFYWLQFDGIDDRLGTTFSPRNDGTIGLSVDYDAPLGSGMYGLGARYITSGDPGIGMGYSSVTDSPFLQVRTNTGAYALRKTEGSNTISRLVGTLQSGGQRLTDGEEVDNSTFAYTPGLVDGHTLSIGDTGADALSGATLRFKGKFRGGFYSSGVVSAADADALAMRFKSLAP